MTHTRKRFDEDPYLARCDATVIAVHPEGIELDETVCCAQRRTGRRHRPGDAI